MKDKTKEIVRRIKRWLGTLSFRTGVIVLALCVPFYVLSFAQMGLNISYTAKTALWVLFFGLAKTTQYAGLAIIGVEGLRRLREWFASLKRKKI